MPRHGVDGEVAPREIVLDAGGARHLFRMPSVGIEPVEPVGRHLDALTVDNRRDAAELDARLHDHDARGAQGRLVLLPCSRAAQVDIVAGAAHERIAHPAAHNPSLKPRRLKNAQGTLARIRKHGAVQLRSHAVFHDVCLSPWSLSTKVYR